MRLYDTQRSGNAWKVRLLASLLGLDLERITLSIDKGDLKQASFLATNPLAQVPVLELDDGRTLSESFAILFYLAQGTAWWPADAFAQAQVLTWLSFEQAQHMRPIAQLRLHLGMRRDRSADDADMKACRTEALDVLRLLDNRLGEQGPDKWVATADHPSIADIALYPYTRLSPLGGLDLDAFPHVSGWLARIEALPGYQALYPGRPELNLSTKEI
ncbi:MAG: glutathione S-transferase family protein [Reyranellales bacterium]|jgi:glutathione S-transferase